MQLGQDFKIMINIQSGYYAMGGGDVVKVYKMRMWPWSQPYTSRNVAFVYWSLRQVTMMCFSTRMFELRGFKFGLANLKEDSGLFSGLNAIRKRGKIGYLYKSNPEGAETRVRIKS